MLSLLNVVLLLLVAGTMSSASPAVSVAVLGVMLVSATILVVMRQSFDRFGILILFNYAFWLLTGFMSGGLELGDFAELTFYGGEGRIFLAYIPALFFAVVVTTAKNAEFLVKLLLGVSILLALAALAYQIGLVPGTLTSERGHLRLLFSSHHSAGSMGAMLIIVAIVTYIERPEYRRWLALVILGLMVFMASVNSRTALVGLFAVLAWAIMTSFRRMSAKQLRYVVIGALMMALLPPLVAAANQTFADRLGQLFDKDTWENSMAQIELTERMGDLTLIEKVLASQESGNILSRVRLWAFAVDRFARSPIIGIGFGRWNDERLHYDGIDGVLVLATSALWRSDGVSTAHSSYFHMLAEGGLVGLLLIVGFWVTLYRRTAAVESLAPPGSADRILALSARMVIVFVLASGIGNHAFAAPAYTLLALTLAGVCLRRREYLVAAEPQPDAVPAAQQR